MNVLSLFDGMSCGRIALDRAGIKVDNYFASEIKKHAIKVSKENYPSILQLGDIEKIDLMYLKSLNIDLLIGGSPCKGISRLNQKQEGLLHKESRLFWRYLEILKAIKPKYFLLENTHGNKEATNIITEEMKCKPHSINSKLFTAQNRPRYYWTNIGFDTNIADKSITTKDILIDNNREEVSLNRLRWITGKSGISSVKKGYTKVNPYPKSGCLTANGHKKWNCNYMEENGKYFYLTKNELERLQTIPIGYTDSLTYDEAYDVIGDGWTVDVIAHILSGIKQTKEI